ncbi:MAG: GTPase, partial [Thermoprotei archaeon]
MIQVFNVFIIGPAGSGKTALTNSLSMWLDQYEVDNIKVNLDPA